MARHQTDLRLQTDVLFKRFEGTRQLYYLSGWVLGDGSLNKVARSVELFAAPSDGTILQQFKSVFGLWHNIGGTRQLKSGGVESSLRLYSDWLLDELQVHRAKFPDIRYPQEFFAGWLHSDGSVSKCGCYISTSIHYELLCRLKQWLGVGTIHSYKQGVHRDNHQLHFKKSEREVVRPMLDLAFFDHPKKYLWDYRVNRFRTIG